MLIGIVSNTSEERYLLTQLARYSVSRFVFITRQFRFFSVSHNVRSFKLLVLCYSKLLRSGSFQRRLQT